jgi:adhesin transport system outer membrane protein
MGSLVNRLGRRGTGLSWKSGALVLLVTSGLGMPSIAIGETLVEEMTGLLNSHPRLNAAAKSVLSSDEAIRQARAAYLPTVKLSGDTGPEYIENKTRSTTNDSEPWYRKRDSASVTITQKLFDGNATESQVASARLNRDVSATTVRSTRQEILLEAATAYINVKRWTRQVEFATQKESNIQGQLALEDERVKRGSGIALDVVQAKQRLQRSKEDRVRAEGELENAITRYSQVFGHPPQVGQMQDVDPPAQLLPPNLNLALDIAGSENPTLANADLSIDINAEKRRLAEAGYYPTFDLVGKANYEDNKNLTLGVRRDMSLLIQGNWEIFSGFKTDAAISQAAFDYAAAKDQRMHAGRKVIEATKIAWRDMTTARDRLDLLSNAVDLAYEMVDGMRKQREAGKATVREVLDQETALYDAQITYNEAFQDMRLAMYRLLWSIGRLEVEDLARIASQAMTDGDRTQSGLVATAPEQQKGDVEASAASTAILSSNASPSALQALPTADIPGPTEQLSPPLQSAATPPMVPLLTIESPALAQPAIVATPQTAGIGVQQEVPVPQAIAEMPALLPTLPRYEPATALISPPMPQDPAPVLIPPASAKIKKVTTAAPVAPSKAPSTSAQRQPQSAGLAPKAPIARTAQVSPAEGDSAANVLGGGLGFGR